MEPSPADKAGTNQLTKTETDADEDGQPHPTPDPESKDDGSVPEKQIARWKDEGGSWCQAD